MLSRLLAAYAAAPMLDVVWAFPTVHFDGLRKNVSGGRGQGVVVVVVVCVCVCVCV